MNLSDIQSWWEAYHTPTHVRAHCQEVAKVGRFLAETLKKTGEKVDPETVWVAGMLHDVVRVVDFRSLSEDLGTPEDQMYWKQLRKTYKGRHHADVAADLLFAEGETILADIIRRHKYVSITTTEKPTTWEAKLLYYADKRVAHDQIVSLQERLEEGHRRNTPNHPIDPREKARRDAIGALEKEIFALLPFTPKDLRQAIQ